MNHSVFSIAFYLLFLLFSFTNGNETQEPLSFSFVDQQGEIGSFKLHWEIEPDNCIAPDFCFFPDGVITEFKYLDFTLTNFHVSISRNNSLFGIVHNTLPGSDFNFLFEGRLLFNDLSSNPQDYIFLEGGIYTDKYGSRDIVVFKHGGFESPPEVDSVPSVISGPFSKQISVGKMAAFVVNVSGTDLQYKWYHNGEELNSNTGPTYSISQVTDEMNGDELYCILSNEKGSDTSQVATLTVEGFDGWQIPPVSNVDITPDGIEEEHWINHATELNEWDQKGSIESPEDLSASIKATYDDSHLYLFIDVQDETIIDTAGGDEIVVEFTDKASPRLDDVKRLSIQPGREGGSVLSKVSVTQIPAYLTTSVKNQTGYTSEWKIPWSYLGSSPSALDFQRIAISISDNDGGGTEGMLTLKGQKHEEGLLLPGDRFHVAQLAENPVGFNLISKGRHDYHPGAGVCIHTSFCYGKMTKVNAKGMLLP